MARRHTLNSNLHKWAAYISIGGLLIAILFVLLSSSTINKQGVMLFNRAAPNNLSPVNKWGNSIQYVRGNNNYISDIVNTSSLNPHGPMTVETWIRFDDAIYPSEPVFFVYKLADFNYPGGRTTSALYYFLYYQKRLTFSFTDTTRNMRGFASADAPGLSNIGTWHHVAGVYDGTNGKLFIDGHLVSTLNLETSYPLISDTLPLLIPGTPNYQPNNASYPFTLDELRISNNARYVTDFTPSYLPFTSDPNTLLLYHFDETDGATSVQDSSGLQHTGYVTGTVHFIPSSVPNPFAGAASK